MGTHHRERYEKKFIKKSREVHGDKYDYSSVRYVKSSEKVEIICPRHGSFYQTPSNHMKGTNCPNCRIKGRPMLTSEEFIHKAKKIHGDKYDYSSTHYKGANTSLTIICPVHGEFLQRPSNHLSGGGCKKCYAVSMCLTTEEFIKRSKEVHGDKYDYPDNSYRAWKEGARIICPIHGEFLQCASAHLSGSGCSECWKEDLRQSKTLSTEEFTSKALTVHGDKYDYSLVEYISAHDKVTIICPIHGQFNQAPYSHLNGRGCYSCSNTKRTKRMIANMSSDEKDLPHSLYHVRFSKECLVFDKIGVCKSRDVVRFRFSDYPYKDFDIEVIGIKTGRKEDILLEEMEILDKIWDIYGSKTHFHDIIGREFGGVTECFYQKDFDPSDWFNT